jgi:hypothetical protein
MLYLNINRPGEAKISRPVKPLNGFPADSNAAFASTLGWKLQNEKR